MAADGASCSTELPTRSLVTLPAGGGLPATRRYASGLPCRGARYRKAGRHCGPAVCGPRLRSRACARGILCRRRAPLAIHPPRARPRARCLGASESLGPEQGACRDATLCSSRAPIKPLVVAPVLCFRVAPLAQASPRCVAASSGPASSLSRATNRALFCQLAGPSVSRPDCSVIMESVLRRRRCLLPRLLASPESVARRHSAEATGRRQTVLCARFHMIAL